ncbi:MAG: hypothetical protein COA47_17555 [Robiginitomaculum sp.]|nr:MAG: hypothetical protein COA47_17555 [Robiginitomaculum sp.]
MSFASGMYLFIFFLSFLFGTLIGPLLWANTTNIDQLNYTAKSINSSANWLLFFSLIAILLLVIKFLSFIGDLSFSLADITEMRLSRGRDPGEEKAGSFAGVLGLGMSGFPVIAYIYKDHFSEELSAKKSKQLHLVFWIGIFVSFLSGGRFAAMISILIVGISHLIKIYIVEDRHHRTKVAEKLINRSSVVINTRKKKSFFQKIIMYFLYGSVLYIFSMIFINRAIGDEDNLKILLNVLSHNLGGISLPYDHKEFLLEHPIYIPLYFIISLFQYYIGHAMYQFDILFSAPYPDSAPYFLTYQFYPQVTLLNKMGMGFMTIYEILGDIENPGVYFTLAGAYILDFGYVGGCVAIFVTALVGSRYWVRLVRIRSFFDVFASLLFLVLIVFSPIVAITGTGVFPSLFSIAFILKLLLPKAKKTPPMPINLSLKDSKGIYYP